MDDLLVLFASLDMKASSIDFEGQECRTGNWVRFARDLCNTLALLDCYFLAGFCHKACGSFFFDALLVVYV